MRQSPFMICDQKYYFGPNIYCLQVLQMFGPKLLSRAQKYYFWPNNLDRTQIIWAKIKCFASRSSRSSRYLNEGKLMISEYPRLSGLTSQTNHATQVDEADKP